jgi:hypothetical protein
MRTKIPLKKFIAASVAAFMAAASAGCFDLGGFSEETDYYESFGDIGLVYQNPESLQKDVERDDYSVQDYFYNKNTGEDFAYGDPKDEESDEGKVIPQLSYVYMSIPVTRAMTIDSFALYFNAVQTGSLEVYFYVVDELPNDGDFTTIRLLGEPEYQQKLDEDGKPMFDINGRPIFQEKLDDENNPIYDANGNPVYVANIYSDPSDSLIVAKATAHVTEGEWVSLIVDTWNGASELEIKESQYLLLRFVNNSGLNTGDQPTIDFRVTNLLIRAFF